MQKNPFRDHLTAVVRAEAVCDEMGAEHYELLILPGAVHPSFREPQGYHYPSLEHLIDAEWAELETDIGNISHYAIHNANIDHVLLTSIQDGNELLTDGLFFKLLAEDNAYLGTIPFQNRIVEWQDLCLFPEGHTKKALMEARSNLLKIGRVLARSGPGPGSPDRLDNDAIHNVFENKFRYLETFFEGKKEKPSLRLLLQVHPEWKRVFIDAKGLHHHRSIQEMAIRLTLFDLGDRKPPINLSIRHMRKLIKDFTP